MLSAEVRSEMTKADLVEKVTGLGDLTRRDGEVIVETIFGSVIGALQSGDKIEIRGFGSFRIRQRNPRIGRNPKTGARVEVPAKKVPYFKPSKELRDLVNPGEAKGDPLDAARIQFCGLHLLRPIFSPILCLLSRIPITAIIRPACPREARCEKNRSAWHCVQPPTL